MALHFGGGAPIPWLESLTRREIMRWYAVMERQQVEEQIRNEYLYPPPPAKPKPLPSPAKMRALVDTRIAERRAMEREGR